VLQQKREALQWRPANGFLRDEQDQRLEFEAAGERAA
jgi:hypothetical protein